MGRVVGSCRKTRYQRLVMGMVKGRVCSTAVRLFSQDIMEPWSWGDDGWVFTNLTGRC
jgi:hypothetical protein